MVTTAQCGYMDIIKKSVLTMIKIMSRSKIRQIFSLFFAPYLQVSPFIVKNQQMTLFICVFTHSNSTFPFSYILTF